MSETMDEVLDILKHTGPEWNGPLANHGPMAAEALVTLGRGESAVPWVQAYKTRLEAQPAASSPIRHQDWREALGDGHRLGDWTAFFRQELSESSWTDVVGRWIPTLAPSVISAATHGLIRTAHAVRSLSAKESSQRMYELAEGLGYWAARYQVLPGTPSGDSGRASPLEALDMVERVHEPGFQPERAIAGELEGLEEQPGFRPVIDLVDTGGNLSQFITDLTSVAAAVYLANNANLVAFVHAVTAPSALRLLAPYVDDASARLVARYAWQACSAVYAWYSEASPGPVSGLTPPQSSRDDLIDRAMLAGGAHSLKFTEACLREYDINPNPIYLVAAWDACERVGNV